MSWNHDHAQPIGTAEATLTDGQLENETQLHKVVDHTVQAVGDNIDVVNRASEINNVDGGDTTENAEPPEKKNPVTAEVGEKREREHDIAETQTAENEEEPAKKAKIDEEAKEVEEKPTKRVTRGRKAAAKKAPEPEPVAGTTKKRGPGRPRKNPPPPAPEPVIEPMVATEPTAVENQNSEQKAEEAEVANGGLTAVELGNPQVPVVVEAPIVPQV